MVVPTPTPTTRFVLTFEISPPAVFGLPEKGVTVVAGAAGPIYSDSIHSATGVRAGYGTLPQYRQAAAAIDESLVLEGLRASLKDNFLVITIDALDHRQAQQKGTQVVDRFLQHLSVSAGRVFASRLLICDSESGQTYRIPILVGLVNLTAYNLEAMVSSIKEAERCAPVVDQRLDKALEYFEHAQLLYERRSSIADTMSRHFTRLVATVLLNHWKAVSTIVGDPSVDRDYQSRYRQLGFDQQFFKNRIEVLRNLRNEYDVAHYSLATDDLAKVEAEVGQAQQTAIQVIKKYREGLEIG